MSSVFSHFTDAASLTLNADVFLGFVLKLSCIVTEVFILPSKKHTDIIFSLFLLWIICILVFIIIPSHHHHHHHHPDCLSTSRQSLLDTKALPLAVSLDSPGRRVSRWTLSDVKGGECAHRHTQQVKKKNKPKRNKRQRWTPATPLPILPQTLPSSNTPPPLPVSLLCVQRSDLRARLKRKKTRAQSWRGGGKESRKRCARSKCAKTKQEVNQMPPLLLLLTVGVIDWTTAKPNTQRKRTREGKGDLWLL